MSEDSTGADDASRRDPPGIGRRLGRRGPDTRGRATSAARGVGGMTPPLLYFSDLGDFVPTAPVRVVRTAGGAIRVLDRRRRISRPPIGMEARRMACTAGRDDPAAGFERIAAVVTDPGFRAHAIACDDAPADAAGRVGGCSRAGTHLVTRAPSAAGMLPPVPPPDPMFRPKGLP